MGKFKLPSLDDVPSTPDYEQDDSSVFNSIDTDESLIDLNDPDEEADYTDEEDYDTFNDDVSDDTIAQFKEITGTINAVKINESNNSTAIQFDSVEEGLVYLQDNEVNYIAEKNMFARVLVDTENVGKTKTGITVYQSIELTPIDNVPFIEESVPEEREVKNNKLSFPDKIRKAIDDVKSELRGESSENEDDSDDEAALQEDDNEKRPKKKNKKKPSSIKLLYLTIADFLLSIIMKFIQLLSRIPLLGKIFKLLEKLEPLFKFITRLWLLILIMIVFLFTNLVPKVFNSDTDSNLISIEKDEITLTIDDVKYTDGTINLNAKNSSNIFADFYLTAEVKERKAIPFLGKKSTCKSDFTVLGIDEKKEITLKCDSNFKDTKMKNIDIVLDN